MALNSTAFPNISRVVAGTAILFPNDSILLCDTSLAAVSMTLLEIPAGYWQTTWKLYVLDNSNNAVTNNITINAPSGFLINGAASVVINVNGGACVLTISSNTTFLGEFNFSSAGGSPLAILSNSVSVTPAATSIDFSSVFSVSAIGTAVSVDTFDTGWVNLEGFAYYTGSAASLIPQCRRIGKQVLFRGDVFVPLGNGSGVLIPLSTPSAYNSQNGTCQTYSGAGGCTVSNDGAIYFNNDTSVIPTSVIPALTNLDNAYATSWIIATRQIDLTGSYGTALTSPLKVVITSDKKLHVATIYDVEVSTTSSSGYLGNSLLSLLATNLYVDAWMVNYRNQNAYIQRAQGVGFQFTVFSGITFTVTAANATVGAVYSQGGNNFTVLETIAGGLVLSASSSNLPSTASGTLTKVSGTGDASITYSAYVTIGSNATENAIYTKSGNFFTVRSSITNTTILDTSASSGTIPSGIGVLTLLSGVGDATIAYSAVSQINGNMQFTTQQLAANLPSAPTIVAGTESPINCDASNPYQIGGFVFRLDGLTAYIS